MSPIAPYIVGVNPNAPTNPHSAMASGGNDIGEIDTNPKQETYVLYGAVVGGPDKRDNFYDIRSDWPQTEVSPLLLILLNLDFFLRANFKNFRWLSIIMRRC